MMDFTYLEIKNFEKRDYPFEKVLTEWETRPDATVANLLSILEKAERKDVITDLKDIIGNARALHHFKTVMSYEPTIINNCILFISLNASFNPNMTKYPHCVKTNVIITI